MSHPTEDSQVLHLLASPQQQIFNNTLLQYNATMVLRCQLVQDTLPTGVGMESTMTTDLQHGCLITAVSYIVVAEWDVCSLNVVIWYG